MIVSPSTPSRFTPRITSSNLSNWRVFAKLWAPSKRVPAWKKPLVTHEKFHSLLGALEQTYLSRVLVRSGSKDVLVNIAEVAWIEAADYYASLHVAEKTYLLRRSIRSLEADSPCRALRRLGAVIEWGPSPHERRRLAQAGISTMTASTDGNSGSATVSPASASPRCFWPPGGLATTSTLSNPDGCRPPPGV